MGLRRGLCALLVAAIGWTAVFAGAVRAGADDTGTLVVGTSGDYAPFSRAQEDGGGFEGFDVELARRFAKDRGLAVRFVRFRWPRLVQDLAAGRFDVAMSGVTVRPERSLAGRFSVPVLETGAVALVPKSSWKELDQLDRPAIRIGVNAGGHLERVAAERLPHATRLSIPDNAGVVRALQEGVVQVAITDSVEAPLWLSQLTDFVALPPFTRDRKALLVRPDRPDLAADLDAWLLASERDDSLAALRSEHFGKGPWLATADPLVALFASLDERLSLMPLVAFVKRDTGIPLEVPGREAVVLEAASATVLEAAKRHHQVPPSLATVRSFFQAQMEAAKQVQRDAVADPSYEPEPPLPDLDADLRPALLRIGTRVAQLVLELPPGLTAERVRAVARQQLRQPRLSRSSRRALVDAVLGLTSQVPNQPRVNTRASQPAATGSPMQTP